MSFKAKQKKKKKIFFLIFMFINFKIFIKLIIK